jgi:F0F1-type ATP synthase epsilon subunit
MNTEVLELEIITPKKSKQIPVLWIEVESPNGNFVVGPDHSPLVSRLKERGKLTYQEHQGKEVSIDIYSGIFRVSGNQASVIVDYSNEH